MALVGNQTVLNKSPGTWLPGSATAHASGIGTNTSIRSAFFKWADWVKFNATDQAGADTYVDMVRTAAKAPGYYGSGVWALPILPGEMAARIDVGGTVTASMLLGKLMVAALTGNGAASGTAGLVIGMIANLTASGALSATAALRLNMLADLEANGEASGTLRGIASLLAALTGNGTTAGSTMTGIGFMEADITTAGAALTAASVASAVWDEVLASHSTPGSTGAALSAAGSAGDPWSTVLPGSYTGSQAGALFYVIQQILKNKQKTDPATGVMTVYADDDTTVLFTANVFNDASGSTAYDGTTGINLKNRLT